MGRLIEVYVWSGWFLEGSIIAIRRKDGTHVSLIPSRKSTDERQNYRGPGTTMQNLNNIERLNIYIYIHISTYDKTMKSFKKIVLFNRRKMKGRLSVV